VPRNVHARDGSVFSLQGTIQQLERTLSLLGEALYRPTFPAEEVSRAQQVLLAEIDSIPEDNLEYIKQEMYRRVYAGHPYGRPTVGDRSTVEGLGREQVLAFHQANYTPDRTIVAVNGDVDPERVANWIATRWSDVQTLRAGPLPVAAPPPPPLPETRQHTLEVGRDQWCVNMGRTTLNAVDIRFPTLEVLVAITRGRHFYKYVYEKGVSYRSWIKLWEHRSPSLWLVENDVARTRFDSVLEDIRADLQEYGRGIFSAEEVQLAATRLINRDLLDAQNGSYAALRLARGVALGHSFDYLSRRREALHGMTREAVNSLAREVFGARAVYELILR
jgi:zinc protease